MTFPTPEFELELLQQHDLLIGVDEVGRGAIAGPVAVGATMIGRTHLGSWPKQIRDSKLLSEQARAALAPAVRVWASTSVGFASVQEIEEFGITKALSLAGGRAVSALKAPTIESGTKTVVLLDGTHNWLGVSLPHPVITQKKADRDCVCVAAASVVAKFERDQVMVSLAETLGDYGFEANKGYASASHIEALQTLGPSSQHRLSWLTKILADGQLF